MKYFKFLLLVTSFCTGLSAYGYKYKYSELLIKDYDEMSSMVQRQIEVSKKAFMSQHEQGLTSEGESEAVHALQLAITVVLSRPNTDNMSGKLLPDLKRELTNYNAYEKSLAAVGEEAIRVLKDENMDPAQRATAAVVLENLMSEIRPELGRKADYRALLNRIKDADLKVPDKVRSQRKMTTMGNTPENLSKVAEDLLKKAPQEEPKKK